MNNKFLKNNYAWVVCFACTIIIFCTAGFCNNMLSVYVPYIQTQDLTSTQTSLIFSIRSTASLCAMLLITAYYKVFSLKKGVLVGLCFSITSALIYSIGGNVFVYYIAACFSGFGFSLAGFVPVTLLLENWFQSRKGLALGISAMGSGFATVFFPKTVNHIAEAFGLRQAFIFQAAILAVSTLVVLLLIKNSPDGEHYLPYVKKDATLHEDKTSKGYDTIRGNDWILIIFMTLFYGGAIGTVLGHISVLFTTSNYTASLAALMVSIFGLCQVGGKIVYGYMCDKIGIRISTMIAMILTSLGCFFALFLDGQSVLPCVLIVTLFGLGFAPAMSGISLWSRDISAGENYTRTMKNWQVLLSLGTIVFSSIPGRIYADTGEYKSSFLIMSGMILVGMIFLMILYSVNIKRRTAEPDSK